MATKTEQQEHRWRPNDNSSSTRLKYDLEAEHMLRSYRSAYRKQQTVSFGQCASVVGMVISLIASVVVLVVMGIVDLIKWVRS